MSSISASALSGPPEDPEELGDREQIDGLPVPGQDLKLKMVEILKANPPIEGEFSPEGELMEIRKMTRLRISEREKSDEPDAKQKALANFNEKLSRQRIAWADCRVAIEESIIANPDLSREEMLAIVQEFGSHYGFAERQRRVAYNIIDNYLLQHKLVKRVRERFPDDIALVNYLTGLKFKPGDDFEISVGPLSVDIFTSSANAKKIYHYKNYEKCGGFAGQSKTKPPIYYSVIDRDKNESRPEYTVIHETEHQKNKIILPNTEERSYRRRKINYATAMLKRLFKGIWAAITQNAGKYLEASLEGHRTKWLERAKDEILAVEVRGNVGNYSMNYEEMFFDSTDAHCYYAEMEEMMKGKFSNDPVAAELWRKLIEEEYKKIIKDAVRAFRGLLSLGHSRAKVIAMFADKPLEEWPKLVRRETFWPSSRVELFRSLCVKKECELKDDIDYVNRAEISTDYNYDTLSRFLAARRKCLGYGGEEAATHSHSPVYVYRLSDEAQSLSRLGGEVKRRLSAIQCKLSIKKEKIPIDFDEQAYLVGVDEEIKQFKIRLEEYKKAKTLEVLKRKGARAPIADTRTRLLFTGELQTIYNQAKSPERAEAFREKEYTFVANDSLDFSMSLLSPVRDGGFPREVFLRLGHTWGDKQGKREDQPKGLEKMSAQLANICAELPQELVDEVFVSLKDAGNQDSEACGVELKSLVENKIKALGVGFPFYIDFLAWPKITDHFKLAVCYKDAEGVEDVQFQKVAFLFVSPAVQEELKAAA